MTDIFRPLPIFINDVYKSFFDSVYDRVCVFKCSVCILLDLLFTIIARHCILTIYL